MKNGDVKVGDKMKAISYCGFPDGTTEGNLYTVSRMSQTYDQRLFFIINDEGKEVLPISTSFRREEA
jgi:hypothetical protein